MEGQMGGGEGSADKTIINRMMLRFRPIAPKPAAGGQAAAEPGRNVFVGVARRKRRYVRVSSSTTTKRSGKRSRSERIPSSCGRSDKDELKTLRLLPDESVHGGSYKEDAPPKERDLEPSDLTVDDEIRRQRSTEAAAESSRVTVLRLTNACMGGGGEVGRTDEERWRNLEADTCPAFMCDGYNSDVVWSNAAYRNMVGGEGGVALAVREGIRLPVACPAFSCIVKLQYTWQEEAKRINKTAVVPCDVWRMNNGGFAWRLDPRAGLRLSV